MKRNGAAAVAGVLVFCFSAARAAQDSCTIRTSVTVVARQNFQVEKPLLTLANADATADSAQRNVLYFKVAGNADHPWTIQMAGKLRDADGKALPQDQFHFTWIEAPTEPWQTLSTESKTVPAAVTTLADTNGSPDARFGLAFNVNAPADGKDRRYTGTLMLRMVDNF